MLTEGTRKEPFEEDGAIHHLLNRWDFEELLSELRCNPVLRSHDSGQPLIAKEYFAQA